MRRPVATPDRTLHMIGTTHLDPVWLWPWQEGYQEARATFRSALDRMEEYPDFVFTCDQVVLLSWVEESDPELFERITKRVAEGRWVNAGGWWVEPDCNMPMGESFVRQGLYGQRFLISRFGKPATVGMNVDPFGHNAMLPQILKGQGMDSYCFLRPGPHESDLNETLFWWEAPDGSRVLGYRIPFEYCSPPGDISGQAEKSLAQLDRSLGSMMVFYGVGNHGGGPTKANIESIHRYDRMGSFGRMTMSTPREYFDEILARGGEFLDGLAVRRDDLQHHAPGCYSSHSGIKLWQRRAQSAVLSAERWSAVVSAAFGEDYPRADLERAWKQVLFNQFHDVLPGSAIESGYDDARDQLGEAISIAKRQIVRAHNVVARRVDIPFDGRTQPVIVFNPHPWPVSTDVTINYSGFSAGLHVIDGDGVPTPGQIVQATPTLDDAGRGAIAFRADLPALGYRLYRLTPGAAVSDAPHAGSEDAPVPETGLLLENGGVLENDLVRVTLDPATGWISSYFDKVTGVDVMAGIDGTQHTQISADPTDTWGHRVISYAWPGESMTVERMLVRERGPLRTRVRIERSWGRSQLVEELVLDHDSRAVRVDVRLDWREPLHLLKLRFPTKLVDPAATYEIPFGHLERPVDGAEEPAQSWVDLTGTVGGAAAGLTVIVAGKHGYDVSPGDEPSIGVTAVRSPVYAWHDPKQLDDNGLYEYHDQGVQRFSYELVPHSGEWRTAQPTRRAAQLAAPPRAMLESFHPGELPHTLSFVDDGGDTIMVTAVKGSEDPLPGGGEAIIVRAVETAGVAGHARIAVPLAGREIEADFGPSQLRTFLVPVDGQAEIIEVDLLERPLVKPASHELPPSAPPTE
ncbi:alpha-mannosidase [Gryllotalpicola reticulitermitis]|uniref:Alpha-mannosidase n=1 Tax=Gryllotalpicola reticulitermitis TaxID=1184153 RepID=A0ABV8Q7L2_9MICO